jgi:hypothetical protein
MNYMEAKKIAEEGKPQLVSYSGGKSRYAHFTLDGDTVAVRLFDTTILRFSSNSVTLNMGGYNTKTTREVLNVLTPHSIGIYNENRQTYVTNRLGGRQPFREGMTVSLDS